jgi:hypothetical protein
MADNLKEVKQDVKEGFNKISKSIEDLPKHFATKEEHKANQKDIKMIITVLWTL